jgi:CBS domain-containing protein
MAVGDVMNVSVATVGPGQSARDAVKTMLERRVGAVAVCDGPHLAGIFTERDVLRLAGEGVDLDATRVGDVMTAQVLTVSPDTNVMDAANLMIERRIRHLPVCDGDLLHGMVGIRDLLGTLVERVWREHDEQARDAAKQLFARRSSG